jgi:gamma-D-glutamyl-L-lysine dipeptidyl-peptidase
MNDFAICYLHVAPMRLEPSDRSEMVSQLLFGEHARIVEENEKWYRIQTAHDGYIGWIDKKQVTLTSLNASSILNASPALLQDQFNQFHRIGPGCLVGSNSQAFAIGTYVYSYIHQTDSPIDFMAFAMQFLGTPYLWGGRSIYGIDCSGYTQLIARFRNQNLPRDAYQQAELGETIGFSQEAQTGDYAFFDNAEGRITHVGMVLRNEDELKIIHASGHVRIDLLDQEGIFRADTKTYSHALRIIKRF